jgi:ABC-type branched-subunit amino acid transport system ATPase component
VSAARAAAPALSAHGIVAGYGGRAVLSGVDLVLGAGEILSLIGHNGAGKSTLLRVLFGLHPPRAGEIRLDGRPCQPDPASLTASGVAFVPEGRGVFPGLTVGENFALALWSAGIVGREAKARVEEVLGILPAIGGFYGRRAGTLSGGQQQMVSIGRALLSRPRLLLLDEPSIGLAPKTFQELLRPLRALQQARGMTLLLVEQNIAEAFAISDRVAVLKSGRIVFAGVPADLADHARLMALF